MVAPIPERPPKRNLMALEAAAFLGGSWPLVALIFPGTLVTQPQHLNKCLICLQFPVLAGRKNRLAAAGECGKCAEGNGW